MSTSTMSWSGNPRAGQIMRVTVTVTSKVTNEPLGQPPLWLKFSLGPIGYCLGPRHYSGVYAE